MNIFKYIAKHGPKVLRSCELKVSDPREFNDPFEFCPHVETNITAEQMEGKLQDNGFLENIYLKNSAIRQEYATAADFLKGIEHDRPRWVDFFLKRFSNRDSFLPDRFAEIAAKHVGIVCFSQISVSSRELGL